MIRKRIGFYQEVQIKDDAKEKKYRGQKGVVLGVSEEGGILYGYAVLLHGKDHLVSFDKDEVFPTGVSFSREDFY
jgi:hypothetical protein